MNIVALHTDFRIYWPARLKALAAALDCRSDKLTVIELAGKGSPYAFAGKEGTVGIDWRILFPDAKPEELSGKAIKPQLFALLDEIKPDAIICGAIAFPSGALAVQYGLKRGTRIISFDDSKIDVVKRNKIVEFVKKNIYGGIDAMLYPAEPWQETGRYWGFKPVQLFYGVDVVDNDFWSKPCGKPIIEGNYFVSIGRQLKRKHFAEVVDAYSLFRAEKPGSDVSLVLIGDGPEHETIRERVENSAFKESIKLYPFMSQNELVNVYRHANAFVINSDMETWGLVINESMAAGCPVIASVECHATDCLIEDNINGFKFKSCDIDHLAKIMGLVNDMPAHDRDKLRKNALQTISGWGLDKFVKGALSAIDYASAHKKSKPNVIGRCIISLWHGQYNQI